MDTILITGCSSGIGHALANNYLSLGYQVCGLSRRQPDIHHPNFHWRSCDLTHFDTLLEKVNELKSTTQSQRLHSLFLNAGTFGAPPKTAAKVSMAEFAEVMQINLMAVKATLDAILYLQWQPQRAIASASISSQRPRAGMLSYATSKAALNALINIYQLENPAIEFILLGLCNVKTSIYQAITSGVGPELAELYQLKQRALQPGYVTSAEQRAEDIVQVLKHWHLFNHPQGELAEIRTLLPLLTQLTTHGAQA